MHYFIDGYNMLFRLMHTPHSLQDKRESIIYDLNKKISLVKLDASIVFDSAFQLGESSRSHYDCLEIIFSAAGESADDYILDEVKKAVHPNRETVVTSDKKLAWHIRHASAHTESVEAFILWLNRSYENKIKQIKNNSLLNPSKPVLPTVAPILTPLPTYSAPSKDQNDYYQQIFEAEWEEILQREQQEKIQLQTLSKKRQSRQPRVAYNPFDVPKVTDEKAATETERWLKIFENRLKNSF